MLEARIAEQPRQLSARIRGEGALSAGIGAAYVPGGLDQHRPATRERIGEVVVGDGLDVDEDGLLSVSPSVVAGDYSTAANKPTINGSPLVGDVRMTKATLADVLGMFK